MHKKSQFMWALYAVFVSVAIYCNWHHEPFNFSGEFGVLKLLVWVIWLAFLVYSIHCSRRENLMRTIRTMNGLYWGRQIGIDLYLGLLIALLLIFVIDGLLVMLLWLVPVILFANLAILLYIALHFDIIVERLTG